MTARASQCERILQLLSDGLPHTHRELYAIGCVAHSRISVLRDRGYQIACERVGDAYVYRLEATPSEALGDAA